MHASSFGTAPSEMWTLLDELEYSSRRSPTSAQVLDRTGFVALCEVSHATGYDRHAVTNWVARPR